MDTNALNKTAWHCTPHYINIGDSENDSKPAREMRSFKVQLPDAHQQSNY